VVAAGALAPARPLPGGLREQDGEQQQVQERVEGTTVGARGRWNSGSPRRSSLAPAGCSGRAGRASGHRPRRGGGGSLARRGASDPYRWSTPSLLRRRAPTQYGVAGAARRRHTVLQARHLGGSGRAALGRTASGCGPEYDAYGVAGTARDVAARRGVGQPPLCQCAML
jgi:hypothetical protein